METEPITPVIGDMFPLSQADEAIGCWGEGHARGKTVVANLRDQYSGEAAVGTHGGGTAEEAITRYGDTFRKLAE